MTKNVCDELQIKLSSWNSKIKNNIRDIAIKKGIQISDLRFKQNRIGDMSLTVIKKESETVSESEINPNVSGALPKNITPQSPHGTLPKQESDSLEQVKQIESPKMSQSAQEKLISNGLTKLVFPVYTALGIIELDESEKEQEAKPLKGATARAEFEGLAKDLNEFLLENNIQLPAFLNYASIGISIFMVLVLPILKFKFFSQNSDAKPEYDETEVEVKV